MSEDFKKKYFKTNVLIKNIIGKELINDDNVAVMELVKNSYDAGSNKVIIEFKNIFSKKGISQILIQDDGIGMNEDDVLNKWLNIAYSSKKIDYTQNNRYQAGNKGVGRFSCDRLGETLDIFSRKKGLDFIHLQIKWKDFELLDEIDIQIQDIPVYIRTIKENEFKDKSDFDIFEQGTILKIQYLNSHWLDIEPKNKEFKFDKTKLLSLKNSLERLINPNQQYDENTFKVFMRVPELKEEEKDLEYHKKIIGEIKNQIFDKLNFRTTLIESYISSDGKKIVTSLKDKNKTIFRLIEKNEEFPLLKDIKVVLYYLNPYAKGFFTKQTGLQPVEFGSIFLFINGFRIPPYGDRENDSLGLDARKTQGYSRNFGNREILGRIEIKDFDNNFRIVSSREGIVQNEYYKQLIRDVEKSNAKYNGYFYTTLKRLEKYVVDGIKWDSLPEEMKEATIQKEIVEDRWNGEEVYKIDDNERIVNSSSLIKQILNVKQSNVLDIYINDELIENLIEEDKEKTQKKLEDFIKNFGSVSLEKFDEKTQKSLKKLTSNIEDKKIVQLYNEVLSKKQKVEDELEKEKKSKEELYSLYKKRVREERKKTKEKEKKLKETEKELEDKKKYNAFQSAVIGTDKKHIMGLQHQVRHSSSRILRNLQLFLDEININDLDDEQKAYLNVISSESSKILSISNFVTKANFNLHAKETKKDIVSFINSYINEIYLYDSKVIDSDLKEIIVDSNNIEFICKFVPLEITTLIDNFITNAENANASRVEFLFDNDDNNLVLKIRDNGSGMETINNKVFEFGFSTTEGSGIGLYNIQKTINDMGGKIVIDSVNNGLSFLIRIKNENRL